MNPQPSIQEDLLPPEELIEWLGPNDPYGPGLGDPIVPSTWYLPDSKVESSKKV